VYQNEWLATLGTDDLVVNVVAVYPDPSIADGVNRLVEVNEAVIDVERPEPERDTGEHEDHTREDEQTTQDFHRTSGKNAAHLEDNTEEACAACRTNFDAEGLNWLLSWGEEIDR
jgi:hypothetical protein